MTTLVKSKKTLAPHRIKMSYDDYLDFASDEKIVEWVAGEVITYMPPLYQHQSLVGFLDRLLGSFIELFELGILIPAPFEVKLWPDGPSREPDLTFISNEKLSALTAKRFTGAPDLIIEVVSPSSVTEDRVRKFTEYEKAGVAEYWVIDPRPHQQQADFYVLDDEAVYQPVSLDEDIYHSRMLPNFWLKPVWLWAKKTPPFQRTVAEIMISIEELSPEIKNSYQAIYDLMLKKD